MALKWSEKMAVAEQHVAQSWNHHQANPNLWFCHITDTYEGRQVNQRPYISADWRCLCKPRGQRCDASDSLNELPCSNLLHSGHWMDPWIELSNYFSGTAVFINVINPICTFERIMWRATINKSYETKLKQSQHTYYITVITYSPVSLYSLMYTLFQNWQHFERTVS